MMNRNQDQLRTALRDWMVKTNGRIRVTDLRDDTPILEDRIITSMQLMDLILFLESLRAQPIDVEKLRPGAFRDIDVICNNFLKE